MEKGKIIFEKRFPKLTLDDYEKLCENLSEETAPPEWDEPGAFYKKLLEGLVRIAIPDRIESSSFFIALAKEIALSNEIDTVLTEYDDRIVAGFQVDTTSTTIGLKKLIEYADDVSFGCDGDYAVVSIIYYTHATFHSGKQITP